MGTNQEEDGMASVGTDSMGRQKRSEEERRQLMAESQKDTDTSIGKMSNWKQARREFHHFRAKGNLTAARDALHMAIEQIVPPDELELAGLYNQFAKLNLQMRDPISAEAAARKAIEMETRFGPPAIESDHIVAHHVMLADALTQQGKYSEALVALDRGISFFLQHVNEDDRLIVNLKELRNSIESEKWRGPNYQH